MDSGSDDDFAEPPPKKPAPKASAAAKAKKPAAKKLKPVADLDDDDVKPVAKPKAKPKPKKAPAAAAAKKGKKNTWGGSDSSGEDADMVDLGNLCDLVYFITIPAVSASRSISHLIFCHFLLLLLHSSK